LTTYFASNLLLSSPYFAQNFASKFGQGSGGVSLIRLFWKQPAITTCCVQELASKTICHPVLVIKVHNTKHKMVVKNITSTAFLNIKEWSVWAHYAIMQSFSPTFDSSLYTVVLRTFNVTHTINLTWPFPT